MRNYEVTNDEGRLLFIGSREQVKKHFRLSEYAIAYILNKQQKYNDLNIRYVGTLYYLMDKNLNVCGLISRNEIMRDLNLTSNGLVQYLSLQTEPNYHNQFWIVEAEDVNSDRNK